MPSGALHIPLWISANNLSYDMLWTWPSKKGKNRCLSSPLSLIYKMQLLSGLHFERSGGGELEWTNVLGSNPAITQKIWIFRQEIEMLYLAWKMGTPISAHCFQISHLLPRQTKKGREKWLDWLVRQFGFIERVFFGVAQKKKNERMKRMELRWIEKIPNVLFTFKSNGKRRDWKWSENLRALTISL